MHRNTLALIWIAALALLLTSVQPADAARRARQQAAQQTPAAQEDVAAPVEAAENAQEPAAEEPPPPPEPETVTLSVSGEKTLQNGGKITVTGKAPAGKPVFLEVWAADHKVRASRFDNAPDKETGIRPYKFYLTEEMPASYTILAPKSMQGVLDEEKAKKNKWSFSVALKALGPGAEAAFNEAAKAKVNIFQSSFAASIIGSRGELLSDTPDRKSAMQLAKARFRSLGKVLAASVDLRDDGSFSAEIPVAPGSAPGAYKVVAHVDKDLKSDPVTFTNQIAFPTVYLANAGTSMNLVWPFLLALAVTVFGVLMGAGGGFILNPLLVTLFPTLPHTIVAGTVTPTVLFSQASGIYNYSKIKFISWKLGVGIGLAMLAGGFIGPKLTEMITLSQFKAAFGWILLVLAGLMFWQTTPGYIEKNKKEKAILEQFKRQAVEQSKKARAGKR